MTGRYVALLRGINVGKAKRVAMADLRALVEGLGYREVTTLLNSGNVVFAAPGTAATKPGPRIEQAIADQLGVACRVTVLSKAEVDAAIADNPLLAQATDPARLLVSVLGNAADQTRLTAIADQDWGREAFALGPRVAYLWCPDGVLKSPLGDAVNRLLKDGQTTRNWNTMLKLQALLAAPVRKR